MEFLEDPIFLGGLIVLLGLVSGYSGVFGVRMATSSANANNKIAWLGAGALSLGIGILLAISGLLVMIDVLAVFS